MTKFITGLMIGLIFGYAWHYLAVKDDTQVLQRQIKQYQIQYEDYIDSTEYKAIKRCADSDYWKAECLAWEMNNGAKD